MKNQSRNLLMLGLIGTLGASISWNPEFMLIARQDYIQSSATQEIMMASETAPANQTGQVDLGQFDKSKAGIKVDYTVIDRDGNKSVRYYLKGVDCTNCWQVQAPTLSAENFANAELLQRALAENAIAKVDAGKPAPGADDKADKDAKKPRRNNKPKVTSECDEDSNADQMSCEREELQAILDNCDEEDTTADEDTGSRRRDRNTSRREQRLSRRDACSKKAQAYYNKFLQKTLGEGLKSGNRSEDYAAALDIRNSLLRELPEKFDATIRKDLVDLSTEGVKKRALDQYNNMIAAGQGEETATLAAKTHLLNETYGQTGMSLCRALANVDCASAIRDPMRRSVMASNNKYFNMFAQDFESPIKQLGSSQLTGAQFQAQLQMEFDANHTMPQLSPMTPELYTARAQAAGLRVGASPLAGNTTGMVGPSGRVMLPSARTMGAQPGLTTLSPNGTVMTSPLTTTPGFQPQPQYMPGQSTLPGQTLLPGQTFVPNNGMAYPNQVTSIYSPLSPTMPTTTMMPGQNCFPGQMCPMGPTSMNQAYPLTNGQINRGGR